MQKSFDALKSWFSTRALPKNAITKVRKTNFEHFCHVTSPSNVIERCYFPCYRKKRKTEKNYLFENTELIMNVLLPESNSPEELFFMRIVKTCKTALHKIVKKSKLAKKWDEFCEQPAMAAWLQSTVITWNYRINVATSTFIKTNKIGPNPSKITQ